MITFYPDKFKINDEGTYVELPALQGEQGIQGEPGLGLPSGGTEGQILIKQSSTNYDTAWSTITTILQAIYPVGSIYIGTTSTSPTLLFGFGTWEQIKDRFLLSAGDTYSAGNTGGEATHTLTVDEMPSHSHGVGGSTTNNDAMNFTSWINAPHNTTPGKHWWAQAEFMGGSKAHNNMPPYLVVYVWKRTA